MTGIVFRGKNFLGHTLSAKIVLVRYDKIGVFFFSAEDQAESVYVSASSVCSQFQQTAGVLRSTECPQLDGGTKVAVGSCTLSALLWCMSSTAKALEGGADIRSLFNL